MPLTNQQLLKQVQTLEDRIEIAAVLVELANHAENNPRLQEILKKIKLRPPFNVLEYIKPRNRRGYWARKPYWREHPTIPQLEARLELSNISYSLYRLKGTVERPDCTHIPRNSYLVGELMRGTKFVSEEEIAQRRRQKSVERIAMVNL